MNLPSVIYFLPFLFLLFFGCQESEKVNLPKENKSQVLPPKSTQSKFSLVEVDPYFRETDAIQSNYGPKSITRNIIQDRQGDFWMATWEGIIHYDGKIFTNITNKEKLRRYHTFSAMADKAGNLWFGSIGAGVYRYDPSAEKTDKIAFINFTVGNGLAGNSVTCIFQDKSENIWFGTQTGLSRYDGKTFQNFTTKDGLSGNDVNSIIEDSRGKIWFATRTETGFYGDVPGQVGKKAFSTFKKEDGSPFTNVRSLIEDKKGNIWLGGSDGLWCYNPSAKEAGQKAFKQFTDAFVGYIFEDRQGNIWVSASRNHDRQMTLFRYDSANEALGEKSLFDIEAQSTEIIVGKGQIFGMLEDQDGAIWFGTERGICRYDGASFNYFSAEKKE